MRAAVAKFRFNSFELLLQPSIEENEEINSLRYLRNISGHSPILRATVMKWCNENEIDVNDIFLINQMASMQQHHSNESYTAICKKDSVTKNKLNQVLANKKVNKKAIYISRKHSFNSFEPAPSKKQKIASKKAPSSRSPNTSQKQEQECAKQQKQEQKKPPLSSNMNFKVDPKPDKKSIPKDRLHEAEKDTNQGQSDKFDGNNLYFLSQADIPHYKTNATICSLEIPLFHCSLCNEESFTTHYQLKRHANQTYFNQKHCVFYKSFTCRSCKKKSHTAASSAKKINHYHCPFCSITVKQKSNFLSHIAKCNYKNDNITSKEGETPAEPLFTDKDLN